MDVLQIHHSALTALGETQGLNARLALLHKALRQRHAFIDRLAVAPFEPETRRVRTFVHSTHGEPPLAFYEAVLEEAPSLAALAASGEPRVIQDLLALNQPGARPHTQAILAAGYRASYTLPFRWNGRFEAFVFFDSRLAHSMTPNVLEDLDLFGHLAGSVVLAERQTLRALLAALRTASQMVHLRDPETGGHLERMAAYARVIAQDLARRGLRAFDDAFIEHLAAFAPLHDLGKIGTPDGVLMKPGALDPEEQAVMRQHPLTGRTMVDAILANFGAEQLEHVDLLRHVAEGHHELLDGSGYPHGLREDEVPIAARIIAVADIFDALTSRRPYKTPWPNTEAFAYLRRQAEGKLDRDCVEALIAQKEAVERIQATFAA